MRSDAIFQLFIEHYLGMHAGERLGETHSRTHLTTSFAEHLSTHYAALPPGELAFLLRIGGELVRHDLESQWAAGGSVQVGGEAVSHVHAALSPKTTKSPKSLRLALPPVVQFLSFTTAAANQARFSHRTKSKTTRAEPTERETETETETETEAQRAARNKWEELAIAHEAQMTRARELHAAARALVLCSRESGLNTLQTVPN